jgi:transcriptional regulator GlxA family with amidase domain
MVSVRAAAAGRLRSLCGAPGRAARPLRRAIEDLSSRTYAVGLGLAHRRPADEMRADASGRGEGMLAVAMTKGSDRQRADVAGPIDVQLVVLDGFFASGLSVTADVLATSNVIGAALGPGPRPQFRWSVRTIDGGPVRSSAGMEIRADGVVDPAAGEVVVVFGPGMADVGRVLADVARPDARALAPVLRAAHGRGALVAASCSSTFLLAETGLLDGGEATTSWWLAPLFRGRYRAVRLRADAIVCDAGTVFTAGAAMAQLDLSLVLVRRLVGHEVAHACARYLVIDEARSSQAPFLVMEHLTRHDELVARAEQWMSAHLDRAIELTDVARALGCSERTLARHFVAATGLSPLRFVRRLRLETAARLLATTALAVAEVAGLVGYDDERAFRRAFLAHFGRSPIAHRRANRAIRAPQAGE